MCRHYGIVVSTVSLFGLLLFSSAEAAKPARKKTIQSKVPSQCAGVLLLIGTDIKEGEKVAKEETISIQDGKEEKRYRRLKEGDKVEKGQLLARLDDQQARDETAIKKARIAIAEAELAAALAICAETKERLDRRVKLLEKKAVSDEEVREAKLTYDRYIAEVVIRKEHVTLAKIEWEQGRTNMEKHQILSPISGVIKTIYKRRGEAVKILDPVFLIQKGG